MKRSFTLIMFILLLVLSNSEAGQFTSSTSISSYPYDEGLLWNASGAATFGFQLDDWTYSTGVPQLSSPKLADLDGDGIDEIILTTYGTVPYGSGIIHAWDGLGNMMPGFPIDLTGPPPGTPAIADIDNDGIPEIIQGTWNYLYVFNADGSAQPGWPLNLYVTQSAALADLDQDGDLEIIIPSSSQMMVYHHSGTPYPGFPVSATHSLTEATVGDIDGDGDLEIVAGTYVASGSPTDYVYAWSHDGILLPGFPVNTNGSVKAAPALADLDNDGYMEIIAGCWNQTAGNNDYLYVWDYQGILEPGWPITAGYIRLSSPSVADFDLDGDLEFVIGGWNTNPYGEKIYAFHHDASSVSGFPVVLTNSPSGNINSTPTLGDIDGDGMVEIIVKAVNNIFALNHDGTVLLGFPVFLDDQNHSGTISPTPCIGDPDGDGLVEIFAASCYNNVMLMDQAGTYDPDLVFWGTFRNDTCNLGAYSGATITPELSLNMTPFGAPIVIPASGGSFEYEITIANIGNTTANFAVWTMALLPGGSQYGPLLGPVNLTLQAGDSIMRVREQFVPQRAPAGNYTYYAYAGIYPNTFWASDSFNFTKSTTLEGFTHIDSWSICGNPLPGESAAPVPVSTRLLQNYPNPFNTSTVISFELRDASPVKLAVYDMLGREVQLAVSWQLAGKHEIVWNAEGLGSGVYFVRLTVDGGQSMVKKMMLIK